MIMRYLYKFIPLILMLFLPLSIVHSGDITVNGPIESTNGGFVFPDGSIQITAASAPVAYPQRCNVSIVASNTTYLDCYTFGPGRRLYNWSSVNGVPDDFYFLVTDITISPNTDLVTGNYGFNLRNFMDCDTGSEGGGAMVNNIYFRVGPDSQSWTAHYESPLFILPPHNCLSVEAWPFNNTGARFLVNGYLTTDPFNLRY